MKKVFLLLVTVFLVLGLVACSDNSSSNDSPSKNNETTEQQNATNENSGEKDDNESNLDEVGQFVEDFNNLASLSEGIESLDSTAAIDENGAQVLYASHDYGIIAIYEDDILDRYSVVISKDEPYEELKGNALNAAMHVAAVLDLDYEKFANEFEKALSQEFYSSFEDNYTIAFFNHKLSGQSDWGMVVEFVKKGEE